MIKKLKDKKKKADGGVERSPALAKPVVQESHSGDPEPHNPGPAIPSTTTDPNHPLVDRRQLRVRTGKNAWPDHSKSSLYLNTEMKYAAMRRLQDERAREDFSDLVNRLVAAWLATPSHSKFRISERHGMGWGPRTRSETTHHTEIRPTLGGSSRAGST